MKQERDSGQAEQGSSARLQGAVPNGYAQRGVRCSKTHQHETGNILSSNLTQENQAY